MKRLTEPKGFVNGIACQERGVELYWRLKRYDQEDVTHWMPLPEPPKED